MTERDGDNGQGEGPTAELVKMAEELKRVRKAANITQIDMAMALGLKQSTISRIETARQPPTAPQIVQWYSQCGYALQATAIGTDGYALELAVALESVDEDGLEVLVELARAWPSLNDTARAMLRRMLDVP